MRVSQALAGSSLLRADAEVLLAAILQKDRAWLFAYPEHELTEEEWTRWAAWSERRRRHEPVAYILGEREFYGRVFTADRRALVPRPSTEGVVSAALRFLDGDTDEQEHVDEKIIVIRKRLRQGTPALIVDTGTGSGCIAITLLLERADFRAIATDISTDALALARENVKRHGVMDRIEFRQGDTLTPVTDVREPFLLVSNPPYIQSGRPLMKDVIDYEPHLALFGGADGGELVRTLILQARKHPFCTGIVLECGEEHGNLLD